MNIACPECTGTEHCYVNDSRSPTGTCIRRRRECQSCGFKFSTHEITADEYDKLLKMKENLKQLKKCLENL